MSSHGDLAFRVTIETTDTTPSASPLVFETRMDMTDERYMYLVTTDEVEIYLTWAQIKQVRVQVLTDVIDRASDEEVVIISRVTLDTTYDPIPQVFEVVGCSPTNQVYNLTTTEGVKILTPWSMITRIKVVVLRKATRRELRILRSGAATR